jgi:malate synthase
LGRRDLSAQQQEGLPMALTYVPVPGRTEASDAILSPDALAFVAGLQRRFDPRRRELLQQREERQRRFDRGELPDFRPDTAHVRAADWRVAPAPADLDDRRVEITGPAEPKMMINALNCGAKVFMADLEDALAPHWANVVHGQVALHDAVRRELRFTDPASGKRYELGAELATLVVRPRGWHLDERHVTLDGRGLSASLFDFGLHFFHNAHEALSRGSGPYYYLPKLESSEEARLWNDVFVAAQELLEVPAGTIRATVLIETITAAFEMDEILFELRDHAAGLNAGRWDYIFSVIKRFHARSDMMLPDRAQVTMAVPFMSAYTDLLVQTCHRRGAHAIGGMAAFIPNRRKPEVTERALRMVREDKEREAGKGFDGTWVAHPDLISVAGEVFDRVLGDRAHQKDAPGPERTVTAADLLDTRVEGGRITEAGFRNDVSVALQYLTAWLGGAGAVAINDLMEDAATAEISRAQLWQWLRAGVELSPGVLADEATYRRVREEEVARLRSEPEFDAQRLDEAAALLDGLVLAPSFEPFLTVRAYERVLE